MGRQIQARVALRCELSQSRAFFLCADLRDKRAFKTIPHMNSSVAAMVAAASFRCSKLGLCRKRRISIYLRNDSPSEVCG